MCLLKVLGDLSLLRGRSRKTQYRCTKLSEYTGIRYQEHITWTCSSSAVSKYKPGYNSSSYAELGSRVKYVYVAADLYKSHFPHLQRCLPAMKFLLLVVRRVSIAHEVGHAYLARETRQSISVCVVTDLAKSHFLPQFQLWRFQGVLDVFVCLPTAP